MNDRKTRLTSSAALLALVAGLTATDQLSIGKAAAAAEMMQTSDAVLPAEIEAFTQGVNDKIAGLKAAGDKTFGPVIAEHLEQGLAGLKEAGNGRAEGLVEIDPAAAGRQAQGGAQHQRPPAQPIT